ncbi:60S ribosomal protein L30 [Lemmus lemmus]
MLDSSRLKIIRQGNAKSAILSHNCPALRTSETVYNVTLAESGVHHYSDSHTELGTACEKHHGAGTWAIIDLGDSDIIQSTPKHTGDKKTKKVL